MTLTITVEDRFGILDLYARYAWSLDTMDLDEYLSVFTPDGRFNSYEGHDQLRDNFNRMMSMPDWPGRQHHNGQLLFLDGDSSRCRLKSYDAIVYRQRDGNVDIRFLGIYRDTCVNRGDRWAFEERLWEVWDSDKIAEYRN